MKSMSTIHLHSVINKLQASFARRQKVIVGSKKSRKEEEDRKRRGDKEVGTPARDEKKSFSFACVVSPRWASLETKVLVATVVSKGGRGWFVEGGGGGRQREETGCHLIQEGESLRLSRSSRKPYLIL